MQVGAGLRVLCPLPTARRLKLQGQEPARICCCAETDGFRTAAQPSGPFLLNDSLLVVAGQILVDEPATPRESHKHGDKASDLGVQVWPRHMPR